MKKARPIIVNPNVVQPEVDISVTMTHKIEMKFNIDMKFDEGPGWGDVFIISVKSGNDFEDIQGVYNPLLGMVGGDGEGNGT